MKQSYLENFQKACKLLEIKLSEEHLEKFRLYSKELRKWNKKINLISRKSDKENDIYRHFLDSIIILKAIEIPKESKLLDLGSGAGFPGLPLKILRDDIHLILLESKRKKSFFLENMVELMNLHNAKVINKRSEELSSDSDYIEKFDFITSRFMGDLNKITKMAYPFLKAKGLLICYKGESLREKLEDIQNNFELEDEFYYENSDFSLKRNLIILKKLK